MVVSADMLQWSSLDKLQDCPACTGTREGFGCYFCPLMQAAREINARTIAQLTVGVDGASDVWGCHGT